MENLDFWKDKRVLVTGAAGFIGSHLCESLVRCGIKLKAFIRYNSSNSYGLIDLLPSEIKEGIDIITGDLLDENSVVRATKDTDIIFHLAAIPSIPYSYQNPRHVFTVNTYGTINLLLAARDSGVKRVVLASSAGASEKRPLLSPYITSKAAMEKIGLGFHQGLELSVSTIRLMNNYGPRQSARAIIPTIISQALVKDDIHLGALEPRMDFNYVEDTVNAILRTAENDGVQGKILTWGTGINTSIKEVSEMIFSIFRRQGLHIVTDTERIRPSSGPMASLEDEIVNTHKMLNYLPETSIQEGLVETIEWIRRNIGLYKTDIYNV